MIDEKTIEIGDKIRMSVGLIDTLNRKLKGLSLLVEVVDINDQEGVKIVTVKEAFPKKEVPSGVSEVPQV